MTTDKKNAALTLADSRILIAGAASLVGSHTADALLAAGVREVILLDNFAFGTPEAIAHLQDNPRVKVVRGDLMRLPDLLAATEGVDGVLHLAAYMTLGFAQTPWQAVDVNVRGAQNMLEACRVNKVRKIVFASSNAVYGYGTCTSFMPVLALNSSPVRCWGVPLPVDAMLRPCGAALP